MVTQKLYYSDSYVKEASARIVQRRTDRDGAWLLLESTLFYPGGGGQLPDRGYINGQPLIKIKKEDEEIWHLPAQPPADTAAEVQLQLDWPWRLYQMQQHTGQHLLSAVMFTMDIHTVSVHLGEEYTMIEVRGAAADAAIFQQIEDGANERIRRALAVRQHWVTREELDKYPLRRPAGNYTKLRVIEIEDTDFVACAGAHLQNTAHIGLIKFAGVEKIRSHHRLKFYIGRRAYAYFQRLHQAAMEVQREHNMAFAESSLRLRELKEEKAHLQKQVDVMQKEIARYQMEQLKAKAVNGRIIVHRLDADQAGRARAIALELGQSGHYIALITAGQRFFLTYPPSGVFDAARFLKDCSSELGIHGGGQPGFMQGKIEHADARLIEDCLARCIVL